MEYIQGKQTANLSQAGLVARLQGYRKVWLDLGTGDGRYVQYVAQTHPTYFVIGVDACRENLQQVSRKLPANALCLIANVGNLPGELAGMASIITINFPWGSLLTGLLDRHSAIIANLQRMAQPETRLEIWLNNNALRQEGWSLADGGAAVRQALALNGFAVETLQELNETTLRRYPTTWAKRIAYSRHPQTLYLRSSYIRR
jgi:hypothetical protein